MAVLLVEEGTPPPAAEPAVEVVITMREISFSGLHAPLAAGSQVWRITSGGVLVGEVRVFGVA